jgi:hypothetical protein
MYQHIKLTEEQARSLYGQELAPGWCFLDPFQAESCTNPEFQWLKEMPLFSYTPWFEEASLQGSGSVNF